MAPVVHCVECRTPNRNGLSLCVVCGNRLPRIAFPPDRITALAWPGPEVRQVLPPEGPGALEWASLVAALLGWSLLPLVGGALAVLLALRAHGAQRTKASECRGSAMLRAALWLGGAQLALAVVAGTALAAVALTGVWRAG